MSDDAMDLIDEFPEYEDVIEAGVSDYEILVDDVISTLPAMHSEGLTCEVTVFANQSQFDEYLEGEGILELNADYGDVPGCDVVLTHAIGHHVGLTKLTGSQQERLKSLWDRDRPDAKQYNELYYSGKPFAEIERTSGWDKMKGRLVTFYAGASISEYFAEAYSHYVHHPTALRGASGDLYEFMRGVFGGKEY